MVSGISKKCLPAHPEFIPGYDLPSVHDFPGNVQNHRFVRHHGTRPQMGLDGRTTVEESGMITAEDAKDKYRTLIMNAVSFGRSENRRIVRKLGKHVGLVTIRVEMSRITVAPNPGLETLPSPGLNHCWTGSGLSGCSPTLRGTDRV